MSPPLTRSPFRFPSLPFVACLAFFFLSLRLYDDCIEPAVLCLFSGMGALIRLARRRSR